MAVEPKKPEAKEPEAPRRDTVTVFIRIDDLNNSKTVEGSVNSVDFSFPRGETRVIDRNIAMHLISIGEAILIK